MGRRAQEPAPARGGITGSGAATHGGHLRLAVGFYVFLSLSCGLPLVVLGISPEMRNPVGAFLAFVVAFYCGARLGFLAARGELRLLSLTFHLFVYVWLGITPLAQLLQNDFPWPGQYTRRTVVFAYIIVAIGIAAYEIGTRARAGREGVLFRLERRLRRRRFRLSRGLLVGLGAVAVFGFFFYELGGVRNFLVSRADMFQNIKELSGTDYQAGGLLIFSLLRVPPYVAMYSLWWHWLRRRAELRRQARLGLLLLLALTLVVNAIVSSPLNSPRYWFGTIVLSMFFAALPWWRSLSFGLCALVIGFGLLVVFPYADVFRSSTDLSSLYERDYNPITQKGDYDCFQQLANAVEYVGENGLAYGRQVAGTLLFWVPRGLWPDKPIQSGVTVAEWMGYEYTNLSMPLWGEAYLDGGLLLVVVALFLFGYATAAVERVFLDERHARDSLAAMTVPVVAAYQIFFLRGSLMSTFAYLVPILALLFLTSRPEAGAASVGVSGADGGPAGGRLGRSAIGGR